MSEIPFVNLLGDELERAAERARRRPAWSLRRRRLGLFAVAGALLVSGSALAGGLILGTPEQQASAAVACYDGADPDLSGSVAVMSPEAGSAAASPVELCRQALGQQAQPLVACATQAGVAVIPGRVPAACADAGFAPLGPDYGRARARVARVERRILALETSADCIPPGELAARVQQLLDRSSWTGWTARVRSEGDGPCGSVSAIGGDGRRYIFWSSHGDGGRVSISRVAPRRVTDLLYSADRSLLVPLFTESGARCFTVDSFRERAEAVFGAAGLSVELRTSTIPRGTALDDEDGRWTRYNAGCAVLAAGEPGNDGRSVTLEVFIKP